ncbi:MAG: hypothetical protein AB7N91_21525 [Candidatus Tectimicrobiota bacterium]
MLRKQVGKMFSPSPVSSESQARSLDIAAIATVYVTSEEASAPIEHAFDEQRGPGGSRWLASEPGEQTLLLAFDTPQRIRQVSLEIEETAVSRTQELQLAVSHDGGQSYRELRRQDYTFSPPGTTFEREDWVVRVDGVTHLRLWLQPDKGGQPCRATLTALIIEPAAP